MHVSNAGIRDTFLATFTPAGIGSSLNQFGRTGSMFVEDVEVGPLSGMVALVGSFDGSFDADPTTRQTIVTSPEGHDAGFAVTLSARRRLFWTAAARDIDGQTNFYDAAFDPTTEALAVTGAAEGDFIISTAAGDSTVRTGASFSSAAIKFDRTGALAWSKVVTSTDLTAGYGVAVDRAGSVYWTGEFDGTADLDTGANKKLVTQPTATSTGSTFLSKLSTNGTFLWGNAIGGTGFVLGQGISFTPTGTSRSPARFPQRGLQPHVAAPRPHRAARDHHHRRDDHRHRRLQGRVSHLHRRLDRRHALRHRLPRVRRHNHRPTARGSSTRTSSQRPASSARSCCAGPRRNAAHSRHITPRITGFQPVSPCTDTGENPVDRVKSLSTSSDNIAPGLPSRHALAFPQPGQPAMQG
jgi:hypothetical protein